MLNSVTGALSSPQTLSHRMILKQIRGCWDRTWPASTPFSSSEYRVEQRAGRLQAAARSQPGQCSLVTHLTVALATIIPVLLISSPFRHWNRPQKPGARLLSNSLAINLALKTEIETPFKNLLCIRFFLSHVGMTETNRSELPACVTFLTM